MKGSWEDLDNEADPGFKRAGSMVDLSAPSEREMEVIRNAVIQHEGLLVSVFDVLRRVPRRVLMVLKLNDLTRFVLLDVYYWVYGTKKHPQEFGLRPCNHSLKRKC